MEKPYIEFKSVSFAYSPKLQILKDINLKIPQGKITAIMGASGSGKTTLLKLIAGLNADYRGEIYIKNKNLTRIKSNDYQQFKQQLGMLFQFGALFSDMTVFENVAFPLIEHTKLPLSLIKTIVAMKLESVGLTGTQELYPSELSGGMGRRVALARACALDPKLMLYDEPFTGLDPISLQVIAMLIKKLNTFLGQTSILVTHDINATFEIADYFYFIEQGKIVFAGDKDKLQATTKENVKQFITGSITGPFDYKYPSLTPYSSYLTT